MAIYSVGRRRIIIALLLTSALLLTLDLRGTAVIDRVRDVATEAMKPIDSAVGVVTAPIERAWKGITEYDDLERRNEALQEEVDRLIGTQAAALTSVIEFQELLALNNLPSLASIDTEVAEVVGSTANNFDQVVEINKGSSNGIQVGMAVVNQAGLIGKITQPVTPSTARVMLATDARYSVAVRVTSGSTCPDGGPVDTSPSGLTEERIDELGTTTTVPVPDDRDPSIVITDETLPGGVPPTTTLPPAVVPDEAQAAPGTSEPAPDASSTSSTTSTTLPTVEKEYGALEGRGGDRLPQVRFLQDNPALAELQVCDLVETAGGSESLAPPGIPVGTVANRADRPGSGGPLLDVELHADLDALNFVRVVLYRPLSEVAE